MTTEPQETLLDPVQYLRSLSLEREINEVYRLRGASLFRVHDDHFVVIACIDPEHAPLKHDGHALLRRVIPLAWCCFARARNTSDLFEAHHYGPAWPADVVAEPVPA